MTTTSTVVVVGGTGHFGARLCRRLCTEPDIELIVTGRDVTKAATFVAKLRDEFPNATVRAAYLDQFANNFAANLRELKPIIVVHTAGPYQGQDYVVARACIACGSHYVDLADGREFVKGFVSLNQMALDRGVLLVSGASTLPGLSSAVVDHLMARLRRVEDLLISIAPAHQTPRGHSTIAAVLSYCGKPFEVLCDGVWTKAFGWQDLRVQRYPLLGSRLSGACDVPDLALLPAYVPGLRSVTFHAALEAPWEQLALWGMAWLTRLRIVTDWRTAVPAFSRVSDRLIRWGSTTGGMQVRLTGEDERGERKTYTWDLTAKQNHGPEIPCSPALILTRKLLRNTIPTRGALPCLGLITLAEFDAEMAGMDIVWQITDNAES